MRSEGSGTPGPVVRIVAVVELRTDSEKREMVARFRANRSNAEELARIERHILDPMKYHMYVRLSAETADGRLVASGSRDFGFGGPRRGLAAIWHRYRGPRLSEDPDEEVRLLEETYHVGVADIEDAINGVLGRDPELHRPAHLAWNNLIRALAVEGIEVTDDQLIAAPLVIELTAQVEAEITASF